MGSCCACCCTCCCVPDDSISWDYPRARRLILSKHQIRQDPNVKIEEEYVETPKGDVLFTRCYIPKNLDNLKGMVCNTMYINKY